MHSDRNHKIEAFIQESVARFIERESNKTSLVTVTRVELYERGHRAMIYISVMPEGAEESALNFLKRKRSQLREQIKHDLNIKTIPFLDVTVDTGVKALHTIETLLKQDE